MAGFGAASLVGILALLLVTAEDWWPMGRQIMGIGLVFGALAVALSAAEYLWSI